MAVELENFEHDMNPLDQVEDVLTGHNWLFHRVNDRELKLEVAGKHCDYNLHFIWQEELNALQFCAEYYMRIAATNVDMVASTLVKINQNIWMGHFDLPAATMKPTYRYICLLRGMQASDMHTQVSLIEDLVDIAMVQCERFYSMFQCLVENVTVNDQTLSLALMDTHGEA